MKWQPIKELNVESGTDILVAYKGFNNETKVKAETERGCALYKRVPVALSVRRVGDFGREYLFACKDPS